MMLSVLQNNLHLLGWARILPDYHLRLRELMNVLELITLAQTSNLLCPQTKSGEDRSSNLII